MTNYDLIRDDNSATEEIETYERLKDKIAGVLLGSAVADALGWPTEFIKTKSQIQRFFGVNEIRDFVPWEKRTGGRFNTYIDYIQPGEYSDDTQLTSCFYVQSVTVTALDSYVKDSRHLVTPFVRISLWVHVLPGLFFLAYPQKSYMAIVSLAAVWSAQVSRQCTDIFNDSDRAAPMSPLCDWGSGTS